MRASCSGPASSAGAPTPQRVSSIEQVETAPRLAGRSFGVGGVPFWGKLKASNPFERLATLHYLDYSQPRNRVLSRVLCEQAKHNGTTPFLRCDGESYSYSATLDRVGRLASGLRQLGVEQGDNVCLFMASCADYVFLTLACNFLGARWIPVNTDYRGTWLRDTILESEPKLLISDLRHRPHLDAASLTGLKPLLRDGPFHGTDGDSPAAGGSFLRRERHAVLGQAKGLPT